MRVTERSPDGRKLQTIFFPAEPRPVMPTDISEEIVLVHPVQPPTVTLEDMRSIAISGAASVGSVVSLTPPVGSYWWVHAFSGWHNDPTARTLRLEIVRSAPAQEAQVAAFTSVSQETRRASPRSLLIPNGFVLRVQLNTIAATFQVFLRAHYVEYLLAENHPSL